VSLKEVKFARKNLHLFPIPNYAPMLNILNSKNRIFIHLAYWVCMILVFTFFWGTRYNNYWVCFYNELAFLPVKILVVYFGLYYLLPQLLLKGKYLIFLIVSLLTLACGGILQRVIAYYSSVPFLGLLAPGSNFFDTTEILHQIININSVMIIPFVIRLYSYSLEKENRILILSQEKTRAELQLLRNQIQPHFLFNVLNGLYAMALKQSDKTPEMILKLSDLMRYVLQESTADRVPLEKELNYIRNYIDLEKLRYGKHFSVDLQIKGDIRGCSIAPLLMLPFVENAFKHSATNDVKGAWIAVELTIINNELKLEVANSFDPDMAKTDHVSSGIGIQNVRHRLDIIYPGRYSFTTDTTTNSYTSSLIINQLL